MASTLMILGVVVVAAATRGFSIDFEGDLTVMHPRPNRALEVTHEVIRRFSARGEFIPVEVRAAAPDMLVPLAHDVADALALQSVPRRGCGRGARTAPACSRPTPRRTHP